MHEELPVVQRWDRIALPLSYSLFHLRRAHSVLSLRSESITQQWEETRVCLLHQFRSVIDVYSTFAGRYGHFLFRYRYNTFVFAPEAKTPQIYTPIRKTSSIIVFNWIMCNQHDLCAERQTHLTSSSISIPSSSWIGSCIISILSKSSSFLHSLSTSSSVSASISSFTLQLNSVLTSLYSISSTSFFISDVLSTDGLQLFRVTGFLQKEDRAIKQAREHAQQPLCTAFISKVNVKSQVVITFSA